VSDSKSTTLYLVRHGATDANLRRPPVLQGCSIDLPLNDIGRRQAERVAELLRPAIPSAVYSSPMNRARQTAEAVAAPHRLAVHTIEGLTECDVGRWEGMDWGRIRVEFPREYEDFQRDPSRHGYLGGESYGDVERRAVPVIEELLARHAGEVVAVVGHNVVNRVCVAALLGLPRQKAKEIHQANGGVNVIRRQDGCSELITLNSLFHLENELRT
jgi:broad specificity phosphatase PhoE